MLTCYTAVNDPHAVCFEAVYFHIVILVKHVHGQVSEEGKCIFGIFLDDFEEEIANLEIGAREVFEFPIDHQPPADFFSVPFTRNIKDGVLRERCEPVGKSGIIEETEIKLVTLRERETSI